MVMVRLQRVNSSSLSYQSMPWFVRWAGFLGHENPAEVVWIISEVVKGMQGHFIYTYSLSFPVPVAPLYSPRDKIHFKKSFLQIGHRSSRLSRTTLVKS